MARGVNKVIILGRLGKDPEVKHAGGTTITNISLATSENWKDKTSGEQVEQTEWHRVVFFGKQADVIGEFMKKGSQLYVEGTLRTEKYKDKDGKDCYATKIMGKDFQFLGDSNKGDSEKTRNNMNNSASAPNKADDFDEDIPF